MAVKRFKKRKEAAPRHGVGPSRAAQDNGGGEGRGQGGQEIVLVRRQGGAGIVLVKVMEEAPAGEWEDEALY